MLFAKRIASLQLTVTLSLAVIGIGQALAEKDPTQPPITATQDQSAAPIAYTYLLSMIISDGKERKAVINESLVGLNDTINLAKVVSINKDSVLLQRGEETITLTLPYAEVRKDKENE